jgi:hypothetical protein
MAPHGKQMTPEEKQIIVVYHNKDILATKLLK